MGLSCNPPVKGLAGFFFLFVLLFCWLGWILYMAGLARSNDLCADSTYGGFTIGGTTLPQMGRSMGNEEVRRRLLSDKGEDCAADMALAWWSCWFDFIVLVCATCLYLGVGFAKKIDEAIKLMMAMVTVLIMVVGHPWVNTAYRLDDANLGNDYFEDWLDAVRVVSAGVVVTTTFNCILIILWALNKGGSSSSHHDDRVSPLPK